MIENKHHETEPNIVVGQVDNSETLIEDPILAEMLKKRLKTIVDKFRSQETKEKDDAAYLRENSEVDAAKNHEKAADVCAKYAREWESGISPFSIGKKSIDVYGLAEMLTDKIEEVSSTSSNTKWERGNRGKAAVFEDGSSIVISNVYHLSIHTKNHTKKGSKADQIMQKLESDQEFAAIQKGIHKLTTGK